MVEPLFKRLVIIGIGLIGSSIARGAKAFGGIAGTLVICDSNPAALARAAELGLGDAYEASAAKAVAGADGVILCTPVGTYAALAQTIAPHLAPGCVLSDVGSTKQSVLRDVEPLVPANAVCVPAHPIA
ncbi:prephenate dehydrogenase/arogenate dehydrogenase family protein, partial [Acidocella sp.]|uniref:prephenate dehydrogenase/arogenate dehydrogenase family protein n=1 Tax=Acidocella sp. TaxID=50710 RepID=UPI001849AB03